MRARAFDRARRKFELMNRLGTTLLLVCSSVSPDAIDDMARVAADLHELGELAQAHGITVGFEALCWGRHINDYRQAWEAVRRADHAHVGLILDTFHALARKCPVEPIAEIPAEKIVLVQTADAPGIEMDLLFLSRHYRCFPGQGDLPVVEMMRAIAATGYRGPDQPRDLQRRFPRRLGQARPRSTACARSSGSRTSSAGPAGRSRRGRRASSSSSSSTTATIPSRSAPCCTPWAFAAPTAIARRTSSCIARARSTSCSTSRTRASPHSFQLLHGLSVAAMALRVDDAAGASRHATRCSAKPFPGPIGAGRARHSRPSAASAAACSTSWTGPATRRRSTRSTSCRIPPTGAADARPARTIDHVAQVVPQTEFLSWILFYRAILGLEPEARADLNDPRGLIVSRALTNGDRSLRLPLNASQAQASAAGRFIERTAGAGAQHIAFACRDVFAVADAACRTSCSCRFPRTTTRISPPASASTMR